MNQLRTRTFEILELDELDLLGAIPARLGPEIPETKDPAIIERQSFCLEIVEQDIIVNAGRSISRGTRTGQN